MLNFSGLLTKLWVLKNSYDSRQILASQFKCKVILGDAARPSEILGWMIQTGACMVRVETAARLRDRFHQRSGAVDRQARIPAAADGGAGAAPRGSGTHHRVPGHDRHRLSRAGLRPPPPGDR